MKRSATSLRIADQVHDPVLDQHGAIAVSPQRRSISGVTRTTVSPLAASSP